MSAPHAPTIASRTRSRGSGPLRRRGGRKPSRKFKVKTEKFRKFVLGFYKKHGRHALPWRKTRDPYRILVSEVMLQQTQVERVIPFYAEFTKRFPTIRALARAPLSDVLRFWQGLGYNRRAKMLHDAAKHIIVEHHGKVPAVYSELVELPGVGEYTAKAVRVFAWNEPETLIETNIRSVFLYHFFRNRTKVSDHVIVSYMRRFRDIKNQRVWYWALMDYGAHLKRIVPNPSRKSAHHARQKPFKGSDREIRGALLRAHLSGQKISKLPFDKKRVKAQYTALTKEGLL